MMICQWCREEHNAFPSVKRALEILEFKEYRVDCRRAARRWLEALVDTIIDGLPDAQDCEALRQAARLVEPKKPDYAVVLLGVVEKAERARKR